MFFYEALPLFLIVRRWYEGLALFVLSFVTALQPLPARAASYNAWVFSNGDHIVLLMYLPCLVAVLCRPNVSPDAEACTKESGGLFARSARTSFSRWLRDSPLAGPRRAELLND
jgi:hypothetical protein